MPPGLYATSDLHVGYPQNRALVERLGTDADHTADWLLVVGDVGEKPQDVAWALGLMRERYGTVVWVPGNHELWTMPRDTSGVRGVARYDLLVRICRELGVLTPEDRYPTWDGVGGPLVVAPLFLLYDYSFRPGGTSKEQALARAHEAGVVGTDEYLLHADPYPTRDGWCAARLAATEARLAALPPDTRTVLVNHFPMHRDPTTVLRYPLFAMWCGTTATADWHLRFRAEVSVYGHLHIPRTTWYDGVRFEEVSLGYPREWERRPREPVLPRRILPEEPRS